MIKKRHNGNTTFWASGMMLVFVGICLCLLSYTYRIIDKARISVEDAITFSALGAALVDNSRNAITGDLYIEDANECYENYCSLFSENTGCGEFINGEASGDTNHLFFDFSDGKKIKIKKFIIYNIPNQKSMNEETTALDPCFWGEKYVFENGVYNVSQSFGSNEVGIGYYSYGSGDIPVEVSPDIRTRSGTTITQDINKTSIFVEMEIPIRIGFMNIKGTITKSQIVNIEKY